MTQASKTISRRSMLSSAALAALAVPTFAESFRPEKLSFGDLRAIYDGLRAAADAFLLAMNQPRCNAEIEGFFEDCQNAIFVQQKVLVEMVKARKPTDVRESEIRAEILIRHALGLEFRPSDIVELLSDWNATPERWNAVNS